MGLLSFLTPCLGGQDMPDVPVSIHKDFLSALDGFIRLALYVSFCLLVR
jgi:hypothetical protein